MKVSYIITALGLFLNFIFLCILFLWQRPTHPELLVAIVQTSYARLKKYIFCTQARKLQLTVIDMRVVSFHCVFSFDPNTASLILEKVSVKMSVPPKTRMVPIQWYSVNGFWKYHMEKSREVNLRRVTTIVTVNDVHSVVKMNTDLIQIYLRYGQRNETILILTLSDCFYIEIKYVSSLF